MIQRVENKPVEVQNVKENYSKNVFQGPELFEILPVFSIKIIKWLHIVKIHGAKKKLLMSVTGDRIGYGRIDLIKQFS